MARHGKLNGIKRLSCYTYEEAADVTGVSERTVRSWPKQGLHVLDVGRPVYIRGDDLLHFLKSRRQKQKTSLEPDEFYCVSCRAARQAAGGLIDYREIEGRVTLTALCEACETLLSKPFAKSQFPTLQANSDLTLQRHE